MQMRSQPGISGVSLRKGLGMSLSTDSPAVQKARLDASVNRSQQPQYPPRSARGMTKPVNFYCAAPRAKSVYLAGDFNAWDFRSLPMERRVDGWWFRQVPLPHGHHRYRFLVDGKPVLDPQATGVARNERNEEVSLVAVS